MKTVDFPESFEEWRLLSRELLEQEVHPSTVLWAMRSELSFDFNDATDVQIALTKEKSSFRVSRQFLELAKTVSCHRDPAKWELLYRLLWKLTHEEPHLLKVGLDEDLLRCRRMIRAIRRDCHKMKAFVRFKEIQPADSPEGTRTHFVAWFEPEHLIVPGTAPFFKKRFANNHWSILTPDTCVHWDQEKLFFTQGVDKTIAPETDAFEKLWLTYYRNIFNPAPS
jgi:DNA polymerase